MQHICGGDKGKRRWKRVTTIYSNNCRREASKMCLVREVKDWNYPLLTSATATSPRRPEPENTVAEGRPTFIGRYFD